MPAKNKNSSFNSPFQSCVNQSKSNNKQITSWNLEGQGGSKKKKRTIKTSPFTAVNIKNGKGTGNSFARQKLCSERGIKRGNGLLSFQERMPFHLYRAYLHGITCHIKCKICSGGSVA